MVKAVRGGATKSIALSSKRTRPSATVTFKRYENVRDTLAATVRDHGISTDDTKAVRYKRRLQQLERQTTSDAPPPDMATQLSRTLLALNLGLISTAEENYRDNGTHTNLHALIALVELCRGLSNDLKSQSDLNGLLERILAEVLDPALANVAQQIAAQYNNLKHTIAERANGKLAGQFNAELERSGREFAGLLREVREQVGVRLRAQLTGGK